MKKKNGQRRALAVANEISTDAVVAAVFFNENPMVFLRETKNKERH